jgi:hypothetical protein
MTHSLHREGSVESLKNDYVMYARCARGFNLDGATPKVQKIVDIVFDEGPDNAGDSPHHSSIADGKLTREKALEYQENTRGFICCFNDRERMKRVLQRVKDEDIGISIVVSGLIDDVLEMAREVGLKPHTVNLSLGIRGNRELLPPPHVSEFTTMCGHAMVASRLVDRAITELRSGKKTAGEAARMLAEPCICGIVNMDRAARLLERANP